MSETDPENGDGEPQEIKDPNAYVNHRRLRSIFDIRDDMTEARAKVKTAPHSRRYSEYEALSAYRALVDSYIVETEPLLRKYKPGPSLLQSKDYGSVIVEPESRSVSRAGASRTQEVYVGDDPETSEDWVPVVRVPEGKEFDLTGLLSLIHLPDPITAEFELHISGSGYKMRQEMMYTSTTQISFASLDTMVRSVNNFLADIGFELDPEDEDSEPWDIEDAGL
jgi:hypothetical protein